MNAAARLLIREAADTAERAVRERDEARAERDALIEYARAAENFCECPGWFWQRAAWEALPERVRQRIEAE